LAIGQATGVGRDCGALQRIKVHRAGWSPPVVRRLPEARTYLDIQLLSFKTESLNEELDERFRKKLRNRHIPINNKWNAIFKLDYPQHRDVQQDRSFLEFFGSCRNCMHNNSISYKDAHFETKFGEFDFYKGQAIDFITPDRILAMVRELAEIYWALCDSIDHEGVITDPYSAQVE
jgi:hypothetical protein